MEYFHSHIGLLSPCNLEFEPRFQQVETGRASMARGFDAVRLETQREENERGCDSSKKKLKEADQRWFNGNKLSASVSCYYVRCSSLLE